MFIWHFTVHFYIPALGIWAGGRKIRSGWGWWLALNAGAVAAIVALLVVPTYIVSTVKPDESIRYE